MISALFACSTLGLYCVIHKAMLDHLFEDDAMDNAAVISAKTKD